MTGFGDALTSLFPGDRPPRDAAFYNELARMARWWREGGAARGGASAPAVGREGAIEVLVENTTGGAVDQFGILAVDPNNWLVDPAVSFDAYAERRAVKGIAPPFGANVVILQEPVAAGSIGRAIILGITPCKIDVKNAGHQFARPVFGNTTQLQSDNSGPAIILKKDSGVGVVNALVLLTGDDDDECCPGPLTSALGADCCGLAVGPGPTGGPQGCFPPAGPGPCAAYVIQDYAGNQTTVYLGGPTLPSSPTQFGKPWQTANDSGTLATWITWDDNNPDQSGGGYSGGFTFGDITPGSGAPAGFSAGCGYHVALTGQTGGEGGTALNDSQMHNGLPVMVPYGYRPPHIVSVSVVDPSLCGITGSGGGLGTGAGGGAGGGGGGSMCWPCDPAAPGPCYNCQNGQFCSNPDGCFSGGGGGGILGPQKSAGGGCAGCGGGATVASTSPAAAVPGGGCACHGESAMLAVEEALMTPLGSSKPVDDYLMTQIDAAGGGGSGVGANSRPSKGSDTARASTTTLAADPDLQFSMPANWCGVISIKVYYDPGSTGIGGADFKWDLDGPASPTAVTVHSRMNPAGGGPTPTDAVDTALNTGHTMNTSGARTGGFIEIEAYVKNGANSGTFSFRWAQATSNVNNTTVFKGSYLETRTP